ncbi:MAG TPA: flippase [Longimicrobiaceae bacterium]|nr:flippase [Longimicrobiaceae bacterium]
MITGRTIARQTMLNLLGLGLPVLLALVCIPFTVHGLGAERFGILAVAWTAVGYLTLFDLGLGPALTKAVAERLASGEAEEIPSIAWTGQGMLLLFGAVGGGVLALVSPLLVHRVLNIPPELEAEALSALYLIALSIPSVLGTTGLRGLLEAYQRFGAVNALRLPMGAFTYVAPLAVLPFTPDLTYVVGLLVAGRILAWVAHLVVCLRQIPELRTVPVLRAEVLAPLARFGGWVTASNISSSVMIYSDRFLIGSVLSMAAVTFYTTPYDAVTKLWLLPGAVLGALFPAFSATFVTDRERTLRLFDQAIRVLFVLLFPVTLALVVFAREGLTLWLGAGFAAESTRVMQWLAIGVFINSIGMIPGAGLQGIGRPELTGKLNLLEMPFYVALLWALLHARGIEGAAIAWVVRVAADTGILCVLVGRALPNGGAVLRRTAAMMLPGVAVLLVAMELPTMAARAIFLLGTSAVFLLVSWSRILTPTERRTVRLRVGLESDLPALNPP